jgi:hypothetical protein
MRTSSPPHRVPSWPIRFGLPAVLGSLSVAVSAGDSSAVEERIDHIRDGLLPAVLIEGEPPRKEASSDQMTRLHVPGVSIAVIHAGSIEWARGFGLTEVGGPPVTPRTLFQAASISKPVTALAVLRLVQEGKLDIAASARDVSIALVGRALILRAAVDPLRYASVLRASPGGRLWPPAQRMRWALGRCGENSCFSRPGE